MADTIPRVTTGPPYRHPPSSPRGKFVVLAIVGLGILLGLVGYTFRRAIPPRPATQPTTAPADQPAVLPP